MAIDTRTLTRLWIQFLKNIRVVDIKSDPGSGKLSYKRKVYASDVSRFLEVKTEFDYEAIGNAIHTVLARKAHGNGPKKIPQSTPQPGPQPALPGNQRTPALPGNQAKQIGSNPAATPQKPATTTTKSKPRYGNDDIEDIEYRDINEDIVDNPGYTLDEQDVEDIFNMLTAGGAAGAKPEAQPAKQSNNAADAPDATPDDAQAKREDELRRLKKVIRDTMTAQQRKSLWRELSDA